VMGNAADFRIYANVHFHLQVVVQNQLGRWHPF